MATPTAIPRAIPRVIPRTLLMAILGAMGHHHHHHTTTTTILIAGTPYGDKWLGGWGWNGMWLVVSGWVRGE